MTGEYQQPESPLWEGKPIPQFLIRRNDWIALLIRLPFLISATVVIVSVWQDLAEFPPEPGALLAGVAVAIFYHVGLGGFIIRWHKLKHTRYVITSKSAQIFYKGELQDEVDLHKCRKVSLAMHSPTRGRITFAELSEREKRELERPLWVRLPKSLPRFENIRNPPEVIRLLKKRFHIVVE